MTSPSEDAAAQACAAPGWTEGFLGVLAGSGAGVCCVGPTVLGAVGLSGLAGGLASMPFVYHVVLQWIAVAILVGTWTWLAYRWKQLPDDPRWNRVSIVTGLILVGLTLYVLRSWTTHVLI